MAEKSTATAMAIITTLVAALSVTFNVVQYVRAESNRIDLAEEKAHDNVRRSTPDCWFAFGTDRTIVDLFRPNNELMVNGKPPVLAQVPLIYDQLRDMAEATRTKRYAFRDKLIGAFFVIHNVDSSSINGVRVATGPGGETNLIGPLKIEPDETVFVPIDFIGAGNAAIEPELPERVTVRYQEGHDIVVEPARTRVSLLRGLLVRALIGHKADTAAASTQ